MYNDYGEYQNYRLSTSSSVYDYSIFKFFEIKQIPVNLRGKKTPSLNNAKDTAAFPVSEVQSFERTSILDKNMDKSIMPINDSRNDKGLTIKKKNGNKNGSDLASDKKKTERYQGFKNSAIL
ncbi:hypothetical protein AYI69_g9541 [Smittium culicis]|uniref:Uncharacterized protein n=1 Tax=Smittium culicis TaxID=133412 RepID=A0A1R1XBY0_9FUNG|nr:hypothetical protein AYI69_g9541 [Smittium culicis]